MKPTFCQELRRNGSKIIVYDRHEWRKYVIKSRHLSVLNKKGEGFTLRPLASMQP